LIRREDVPRANLYSKAAKRSTMHDADFYGEKKLLEKRPDGGLLMDLQPSNGDLVFK
jgi:hypothetical protein